MFLYVFEKDSEIIPIEIFDYHAYTHKILFLCNLRVSKNLPKKNYYFSEIHNNANAKRYFCIKFHILTPEFTDENLSIS